MNAVPDVRRRDGTNPSDPRTRAIVAAVALCGLGIATYLTLYQLGVVPVVWDPLFGDGSRVVLHSALARMLPVPDASIGAAAYLVEVVTVTIGGRARWRTHPWVVVVYGLTALGLGAMSATLVVLQPLAFGAWCTLCLASAAISIALVYPGAGELRAAVRYLASARFHRDGAVVTPPSDRPPSPTPRSHPRARMPS